MCVCVSVTVCAYVYLYTFDSWFPKDAKLAERVRYGIY